MASSAPGQRSPRDLSPPLSLRSSSSSPPRPPSSPSACWQTYTGPLAQRLQELAKDLAEREGDLDPENGGGSGELVPLLVASAGARYP